MSSFVMYHPEAFSLSPSPVCVPLFHQNSHAGLESAEEPKREHCFAFSGSHAETTQSWVKCCLREPMEPGF